MKKNVWLVSIFVLVAALVIFVWRTTRTQAAKTAGNPTASQANGQAIAVPVPVPLPSSAPAPKPADAAASAPASAAIEQRLGPFAIGDKAYTAILRKQAPAGAKPGEGETVVNLEIRDASGASQYARAFPNVTQVEGFVDTMSVFVNLLSGSHGGGLLVSYDEYSEPSATEME